MEHYGVNFPAPYVPHNVKMRYDGRDVDLTPAQEEVATFYAEMPLDGPQLGDPKTKKVFDKNFFKDFKKYLGSKHVIKKFELCITNNLSLMFFDFSMILCTPVFYVE